MSSFENQNHYQVLKVRKNATHFEIYNAYMNSMAKVDPNDPYVFKKDLGTWQKLHLKFTENLMKTRRLTNILMKNFFSDWIDKLCYKTAKSETGIQKMFKIILFLFYDSDKGFNFRMEHRENWLHCWKL